LGWERKHTQHALHNLHGFCQYLCKEGYQTCADHLTHLKRTGIQFVLEGAPRTVLDMDPGTNSLGNGEELGNCHHIVTQRSEDLGIEHLHKILRPSRRQYCYHLPLMHCMTRAERIWDDITDNKFEL